MTSTPDYLTPAQAGVTDKLTTVVAANEPAR